MTAFITISALVIIASAIAGAIEGKLDATYGTDPDHSKDFKKRLAVGAVVAIIVNRVLLYRLLPQDDWWLYDRPFVCVIATLLYIGCIGFIYGFCLDVAHNTKKRRPVSFVGSTAQSDIWANKNGIKFWVFAKLGGAIISGIMYYAWTL